MKRCRNYTHHTQGSKWIRPAKRLAIYLRDSFCCQYCGRNLRGASSSQVTLDHLVPRWAGGSNEATNLITACLSCNSSRAAKIWFRFATGGAILRIRRVRYLAINVPLAKSILEGKAKLVEGLR